MNKSVLTFTAILLLFLEIGSVKAQCAFTLAELEKTCKLTSTEFETYIISKGYMLSRSLNDPIRKEYLCDRTKSNPIINSIRYSPKDSNSLIITFKTTDEKLFQNTKDSLLIKGYTFSKKDNWAIENQYTNFYFYTKGKIQITICHYRIYYLEEIRILD